jgi:hypothetical protein
LARISCEVRKTIEYSVSEKMTKNLLLLTLGVFVCYFTDLTTFAATIWNSSDYGILYRGQSSLLTQNQSPSYQNDLNHTTYPSSVLYPQNSYNNTTNFSTNLSGNTSAFSSPKQDENYLAFNSYNNAYNTGYDYGNNNSNENQQEIQVASGGYLAMGTPRPFHPAKARILEPRYPSYDHWSQSAEQPWTVQLLPEGKIFPSYLAGMKESRIANMWVYDKNFGEVWDVALGGRDGLLRFGTPNAVLPEGIQLDIEGAVLLRLDISHERDMMANDFRAGVPLTFGGKNWQFKLAYYHLSSHMGDEYTLRTHEPRLNYVRDSLVFAVSRRFCQDWRAYAETAWAFFTGDETLPWEFQLGVEYSPAFPANNFHGTPFAAVHAHLFQELDFGGYLAAQLGWQWRGKKNQLFRLGVQFMTGHDDQFEYHLRTTQKIGFGIWYDF